MSYFTTGEKKHVWTVKQGSTGPEAGAAIHTDFKDNTSAQVSFEDLIATGRVLQPENKESYALKEKSTW